MKLFLDTNVWLRYFIGDNDEHLIAVRRIIEQAETGKVRLATSTFILSEFVYVENSFYKIQKQEIIDDLKKIQSVKNIKIVEKTDFVKSLRLFEQARQKKWSDCVIIAQTPEEYLFCSFDERLKKLVGDGIFVNPLSLADGF